MVVYARFDFVVFFLYDANIRKCLKGSKITADGKISVKIHVLSLFSP